MTFLKLSEDISLPLDTVTQAIAILAKRRVGKSYTMRRLVEQLFKAGQQIAIVDPKGDQWGIRSSADGKSPGLPILILGGEHGDLPLEVNAGETIANLVVKERVSVLLDISLFRKHEVATFMTGFLENLYRLKAQEQYRTPMMLVIDEADAIAPQKPQKGEERMLGAANDIVRRGGQRGIGCTLVTQRSAVLNKNVLTQCEMLIVLRTIAPHDLAAMKAWVDVHGTDEEGRTLIESLPSLPIGDAWFWSPGWPTANGIFKRTHVLPIETFDSGATPRVGEKKIVPKHLADVDLDSLKSQMAETIEKTKNDDPKLLRRRIAELEKQKSVLLPETRVETRVVEKPVFTDAQIKELSKIAERMYAEAERHGNAMSLLWTNFDEIGKGLAQAMEAISISLRQPVQKPITTSRILSKQPVPPPSTKISLDTNTRNLSKGARSVLSYLHGAYPHWKSKTQLWVATGYAPGGGFNNLVYELTGAGLIEKDGSGKYASLEPCDPSLLDPDFDSSLGKWDSRLSLGARKIFHLLMQNPDSAYSKEEIAQELGYAQGGGFNNLIYELTGKELVKKIGTSYQINPVILDL